MPLLSYRTETNGLKKNWCFVHSVHMYIIYLNIYNSKQRVQLPDFQFLSPTCNGRHNRAFSVKVGHITCIWNSWPLKIWDWIGMNLYRDYLYKLNGLIAWHYRIYTILQFCTSRWGIILLLLNQRVILVTLYNILVHIQLYICTIK